MSLRILLVDDEDLLLRSIARPLRAHGYAVSTAYNGKLALEVLANEPIDLVLSDIWMPEMDGWTLLRSIKERRMTLPVVLFSGLYFPNQEAEALQGGAAAFLMKPLKPGELTEVLERVAREAGIQA